MIHTAETILRGAPHPSNVSPFKVMKSNAGWYVGTSQDGCPYSRESGYFPSVAAATEALRI